MFKRMMTAAIVFGAAALAPPLLTQPASAQSAPQQVACGERADIVKKLNRKYGEVQSGAGLMNNGTRIIELWQSEKSGSWTFLMTLPNGTTCIMAAGEFWNDTTNVTEVGDPV